MKYQQLSAEERFLIAALRAHWISIPDIATLLKRNRSTVWWELRRNCAPCDGGYGHIIIRDGKGGKDG
jgi:transposase, IS30 family